MTIVAPTTIDQLRVMNAGDDREWRRVVRVVDNHAVPREDGKEATVGQRSGIFLAIFGELKEYWIGNDTNGGLNKDFCGVR